MKRLFTLLIITTISTFSSAQMPIEYLDSTISVSVDKNGVETEISHTVYHYDEQYRDTLWQNFVDGVLDHYVRKQYLNNEVMSRSYFTNSETGAVELFHISSVRTDNQGRIINYTSYQTEDLETLIPRSTKDYIYENNNISRVEQSYEINGIFDLYLIETYTYNINGQLEQVFADNLSPINSIDNWTINTYDDNGNLTLQIKDAMRMSTGVRITRSREEFFYKDAQLKKTNRILFDHVTGLDTLCTDIDTIVYIDDNTIETTSFNYKDGSINFGSKVTETRGDNNEYISYEQEDYSLATQKFKKTFGSENTFDRSIAIEELAAPFYDSSPESIPFKLVQQTFYDTGESGEHLYRITRKDILIHKPIISTSNKNLTTSLNIYPNPASDYIIISGDHTDTEVTITNINGQILFSNKLSSNRVDIRSLAQGLYNITVLQKGKRKTAQVFVTK